MSTLIEIENAVTTLPAPEQRSLLKWLQAVVNGKQEAAVRPPRSRRDAWLARLAERRQRGITDKKGTPLQRIMDDLRGE